MIEQWALNAEEKIKENERFYKSISGDSSFDRKAARIHEATFKKADCLLCANCCKTTPALIEKSDVKRIAKYLGIPPKTFIRKYILNDINGEMVINHVPCFFLQDDHTCSIYEVRPKACREYPHTNQEGFYKRAKMNTNNTIVCPAVFHITEVLKNMV